MSPPYPQKCVIFSDYFCKNFISQFDQSYNFLVFILQKIRYENKNVCINNLFLSIFHTYIFDLSRGAVFIIFLKFIKYAPIMGFVIDISIKKKYDLI